MASLLVTATRNVKPGIKKRTLSEKVQVGSVSLTVVLILLTSVISVIYLFYVNIYATKGYTFKTLEQERTKLTLNSEEWDMKIARSKSLESLKNNELVSNMVKDQQQPLFIRGDTAVASNK